MSSHVIYDAKVSEEIRRKLEHARQVREKVFGYCRTIQQVLNNLSVRKTEDEKLQSFKEYGYSEDIIDITRTVSGFEDAYHRLNNAATDNVPAMEKVLQELPMEGLMREYEALIERLDNNQKKADRLIKKAIKEGNVDVRKRGKPIENSTFLKKETTIPRGEIEKHLLSKLDEVKEEIKKRYESDIDELKKTITDKEVGLKEISVRFDSLIRRLRRAENRLEAKEKELIEEQANYFALTGMEHERKKDNVWSEVLSLRRENRKLKTKLNQQAVIQAVCNEYEKMGFTVVGNTAYDREGRGVEVRLSQDETSVELIMIGQEDASFCKESDKVLNSKDIQYSMAMKM